MATVSLQSAFDAARRALDAGTADRAVAVARYILAHYPHNIEAQRLLGEALLNAGDAEAAAEAFGQVLQADPESIAAYYGRGLAFAARDDRMAAVRSFERALEIQPNLAELRTQLIRLYGEAPGSSPQLRLSRAGLARLYTRGGMYGQAVDEFRAIEAEADRPDVEAALAEALWRDGQEDEAAAYCRQTLDRRPGLLKPRLLLGYLLYAGGQPEGEELWRAGAQQDPGLAIARHLFDILPPIRLEEPLLPAFDTDELVARGFVGGQPAPAADEQSPEIEATMLLPEQPALIDAADRQPSGSASDATAPVEAFDDDALLVDHAATALPNAEPLASRDTLSDAALLASLLGIDMQEPAASASPERPEQAQAAVDEDTAVLDDTAYTSVPALEDTAADDKARVFGRDDWPQGGETWDADQAAEVEPFALDELALDSSETAGQTAPWDEPSAPPPDEPEQTAFSSGRPDPAFALGEASRSTEADASPFDEWPAGSPASNVVEPALEPGATRDLFSLDDLADDTASWEQEQVVAPADEEKMPFSLAELGIDTAQPGAAQTGSTAGPSQAAEPPASWEAFASERGADRPHTETGPAPANDTAGSRDKALSRSAGQHSEPGAFSLADLGLTDEEIAALDLDDSEPSAAQPPDQPAESSALPDRQGHATPRPDAHAAESNGLQGVFQQLESDPDNPSLRLAVARLSSQSGETGRALEHYRQLVRSARLLDDVAADLEDLVSEGGDLQLLRRLHRLLGDTYMKQNRVQEALDQYSWTSEQ